MVQRQTNIQTFKRGSICQEEKKLLIVLRKLFQNQGRHNRR